MNTSDPGSITLGEIDPRPHALTEEIARMAAELFGQFPGAASSLPTETLAPVPLLSPAPTLPSNPGPSALAMGGGGASAGQTLPPTPGPLAQPVLASAPPPKDSDLRNLPTSTAQSIGLPSPILAGAAPVGPAGTPYFLDIAGLPRDESPAQPPHGAAALSGVPATGSGSPSLASDLLGASGLAELFGLDLGLVPSVDLPSAAQPPAAPTTSSTAWLPTLDLVNHEVRPELVPAVGASNQIFNPHAIKRDFPILSERVHGKPLIWLDNAATTQKPQAVIDRLSYFYEHENSNIHRAAHALAARATDAYEGARDKVRRFLGAPSSRDIVFVRGATEAINLVAQAWGRRNVRAGDEIVITWLEHHANIVPWQQLAAETGARLRVVPVDDRGQVILSEYEKLLGPKTRLVSITQVSNALGTVVPVHEMVGMAHRHGARVLVDGAQAVSHMPVDVQSIDCDFYCFSGHKVFGPTGIGALFGKADVLEAMPPWQGGGNMISDVTFEKTVYHGAPMRFEAGTGNIADAVGLGAAIDYVERIGLENIKRYEHELLVYATGQLARVPGLRLIGTAPGKAGVLSFVLEGIPTAEVGTALDQEGIAVRSGHHCAQPILRRFGVESTVRASLAPYNTCEDIDALVAALLRMQTDRRGRGIL